MNIIILAAGQGSRLKPYTNNIPKCLVEVAGKSFLARQIEIFEGLGFDYPVIVAGYKAELIEKNYRKVLINQKYLSTNMLYSLFQAYQTILSGDDTIVCYGDIIFNANLIKLLIPEDSDLSLVSDKNFLHYWSLRFEKPLDDLETFSFYENRLLKDIGGRPNSISEISGQYIGMFKISSNSLSLLFLDLYSMRFKSLKKFSLLHPIKLIIPELILKAPSFVFSKIFKKSLSKISTLT